MIFLVDSLKSFCGGLGDIFLGSGADSGFSTGGSDPLRGTNGDLLQFLKNIRNQSVGASPRSTNRGHTSGIQWK